ncbi:MAG TPA: GNAT family N-acetyltransferase [Thermotogota bacterium]|nr:GNAT family N-acetyltransferase [Thermotogota bacterium]HPR96581.1 GNAT family N-acetyltransferase [Thermotogota bacterium]
MDIRLLNRSDLDAFKVIRLNTLKNSPEAFGSSYEEEVEFPDEVFINRLEDKSTRTFGAFENEELIGLCRLIFRERRKINHKADICSVYVEPHMRQKGVGRLLLTKAIEAARDSGLVEQLYLMVLSGNIAANALYQSLGFKTYGVEERSVKIEDNYYDFDLMVLFLRDE